MKLKKWQIWITVVILSPLVLIILLGALASLTSRSDSVESIPSTNSSLPKTIGAKPLSNSATFPHSISGSRQKYAQLEELFIAYLKDEEIFKKGIEVKPSFKESDYLAAVYLPIDQIRKLADGKEDLRQLGKQVTGVLTISLVKFLRKHGETINEESFATVMSLLYAKMEGVTGKKGIAEIGYSVYNPRSDSIEYKSTLKKEAE